MKKNKNIFIIDALLVLLNIAAGRGNFLGLWLLSTDNSFLFPFVVIVLDIIYLIFRKGTNYLESHNKCQFLWLIWVALLFYNFVNLLFKVGGLDLPSFEYGLLAFLLYYIFKKQTTCLREDHKNLRERVHYLCRGYIWLSMISIFGVFSSFLLYSLGLVGDSPISAHFLESNIETGNLYSRVFISVRNDQIGGLVVRVPFFQDNGIFCGLFHEPHILAYNVFPCFILLLGFYNKFKYRFLIILSSILMIFFAGSATNVLVVIACLAMYFIKMGKINIFSMIIGVSIVIIAVFVYVSIDDTFLLFILDRLDSSNASHEYSQDLLGYAFSPKSITGFNFLSTDFMKYGVKSGKDIGFIAFSMNIVFLFLYLRNTIKLIFKKESVAVSVGFASLYCILHSAKIGMTMYMQILPLFLVFLQYYILSNYGRVNIIKKNRN